MSQKSSDFQPRFKNGKIWQVPGPPFLRGAEQCLAPPAPAAPGWPTSRLASPLWPLRAAEFTCLAPDSNRRGTKRNRNFCLFSFSNQKSSLRSSLRQNDQARSLTQTDSTSSNTHGNGEQRKLNTSQRRVDADSPSGSHLPKSRWPRLLNSRSPPKQTSRVSKVLRSCLPYPSTEIFHYLSPISQMKINVRIKCNDMFTRTLNKIKCFLPQSQSLIKD